MKNRRLESLQIRRDAAEVASSRPHPRHVSNGEELKYRVKDYFKDDMPTQADKPTHIASYTKGLPHDEKTGLLLNDADYRQFLLGIQSGDPADFAKTPLGPAYPPKIRGALSKEKITPATNNIFKIWKSKIAKNANKKKGATVRAWESAGAGHVFDLEGPDAQSVTMPPPPTLDSVELAAEMAEVYLQALLRDIHFSQLRDPEIVRDTPPKPSKPPKPPREIQRAINILNNVEVDGHHWFNSKCCDSSKSRRRPEVTRQNLFRGVFPGDDKGPYLSQFLLIGNNGARGGFTGAFGDGFAAYGSQRIDQRVRVAKPGKDYMTTFYAWLDVQNGADVRGLETYNKKPAYRFITTPRDLATYVHYDALYQAYLNACLLLLGMGAPFDPGLPFQEPDVSDKQQGFAHFGGPHILTLLPEVATRALKAVRFQKFNIHRRLRPEAVGGRIDRLIRAKKPQLKPFRKLVGALGGALGKKGILALVAAHNKKQNGTPSYLLPMAFPEGSPMHPSYGAGHGAVAGACVTILKAFFDHGWQLPLNIGTKYIPPNGKYVAYEPNPKGLGLQKVLMDEPLTVEGELNKVAANISIGRDWAGVHYFSDYIESMRLGEQVALGILEEQKLTYNENFTMTVPLFDGGTVRI